MSSLWPQEISVLHSTCQQSMWPSHRWPWQAPQHVPSFYLCSPSCHCSGSPASARTASAGSHLTSLETVAQRYSGPGTHGFSALQCPAITAAAHRHITPPVKAQYQGQHVRWAEGKPTSQKQRDMILFLHLVFAPLNCYFTLYPVYLPALQNHGSSHLVFSFENMHCPPVNGSLLT